MKRFLGLAFAMEFLPTLLWAGPIPIPPLFGSAAPALAESKTATTTSARPETGKQEPKTFEGQAPVKLGYLLHLPKDYDQKASWPLLLFLHGAGERGSNLDKVKVHGPPKLLASGKETPASQFIVVSPQCPQDKWWQAHELIALVDDVIARHKVDRDRVYVTGLSMGGFGTWSLISQYPERFAAAAPICGGGQAIPLRFAKVRDFPVWAFHGAKDAVVPLKASEEMVQTLKMGGGKVELTVYPEAGHDSWTETFENPKLYQWLLDRKLSDRARAAQ